MTISGIRARFPLGMYVGHRPDGSPDPLPSTLRLHAALVAAASTGSTAEARASQAARTAAATRALEWIEDNPPEYIELPPCHENAAHGGGSYRDQGVVDNAGKESVRRKITLSTIGTGTAVSAPIGWGWDNIPPDVRDTLAALCEDVPCLGEADSAVVLELTDIEPTHRRSRTISPFSPASVRVATPLTGRLLELDALHDKANPSAPPTIAKDRWVPSEKLNPPAITHVQALDIAYNSLASADPPPAPWSDVIHIAIDAPIPDSERVAWSVTLHRAMVATLDTDASSAITGRYLPSTTKPANRVAIQPLDESVMRMSRHTELGPGIAVLVPHGDLEVTTSALAAVTRLYRRGHTPIRLGKRTPIDAATFWAEPPEDTVHMWWSLHGVVPETRRPRRIRDRKWTLADSGLLSVGFVFRDELRRAAGTTAEERYASTVDAVEEQGVSALTAAPIPNADIDQYAHKMPRGVIAQPYHLQLYGGSLLPPQAIVAIGQSRHLGGGLLVPTAVPSSLAVSWRSARCLA